MNIAQQEFVKKLNQLAQKDHTAFAAMVEDRLLAQKGPLLTEHERSYIRLIVMAYDKAADPNKVVYQELFGLFLRDFQTQWQNTTPEVVTKTIFSLQFFSAVEPSETLVNDLRCFLNSFIGMESVFRQKVPAPLKKSTSLDLFNLIEKNRLERFQQQETPKEFWALQWDPTVRKEATQIIKNGLFLEKLAQTYPYMITAKKLYEFYQQTVAIDLEKGKKIRNNTFIGIRAELLDHDLERLCKQTKKLINRQFKEESLSINNLKQFIDALGFILIDDEEVYRVLKEQIGEKTKEKQEKRGKDTRRAEQLKPHAKSNAKPFYTAPRT